ncbi:isocitrate lyase/PEP mutase family protein [Micromonospora sp. C95]|uniref:isocitrate lyase/PEP mutase family protein n=1 Tax=Micromonospora sp. C95 TaxID=2824882 RepID=UPI001B35A220|nr:isocitrate lyase/PEP mutase family protein [Micromonospora sp. C95]MBQ1023938.1 isocitrate lyase/PEP mutase family protein [Micromonospora sp. C95]
MPKQPTETFLSTDARLIGVGAHDALTASLVQRSGFDVAWVGSFEASTYRRMPDINVITSTEMADSVRAVRTGCDLPVFVDADNGYGTDDAAARALDQFAAAGADAMCLEDNAFPKRNSLYSTQERALEDPEAFSRRLARLVGKKTGVRIIARTEALVAGLGPEEAVRRLDRYADTGVDGLFVQANTRHADQLGEVLDRTAGRIPIVLAPTALPEVAVDQFFDMGANVVIYANVVSRAAVRSVSRMLATLREARSLDSVTADISGLDEIFALTGAQEWNRQ